MPASGVPARTAADISAGGLGLIVHERLQPGTIVFLEVSLAGFADPPLACIGPVAWCRNGEQPGTFRVGIRFWWVGRADPATREMIRARALAG